MSAFSFTDEPASNDGGEDSAFSFFSEPNEPSEEASEFTFGSDTEPEVAPAAAPEPSPLATFSMMQQQAAAGAKKPVAKKPVSRVIGMNKAAGKKGTKTKSAAKKFGKKDDSAPTQQKSLFAGVKSKAKAPEPAPEPAPESEPTPEPSPFFSAQSVYEDPTPVVPEEPVQETGFSFMASEPVEQPASEGFSFMASEPVEQPASEGFSFVESHDSAPAEEEQASMFTFGQEEPKPEPEPVVKSSSGFSFGVPETQTIQPPVAPPVERKSRPSLITEPISPPAARRLTLEAQEENGDMSDLTEACQKFVVGMTKYQKTVEASQNTLDATQNSLKDMEKRQTDALMNEQFDLADQLNTQIGKAKATIIQTQTAVTKGISDAMTLANDAPGHLLTHAATSQQELPNLKTRKSALDKRYSTLVEDQATDKETIEIERKKNANMIEDMKRPIEAHKAKHEEMVAELDDNVKDAKRPYEDKIVELKAERDSHNATIEELMAEIERHRRHVKSLEAQIASQEKEMKKTDASFDPRRKAVTQDLLLIQTEETAFKKRIKEIEAPFQSLVDSVEKRETEINAVRTAVEKITQQIEDSEKDATECESAAGIINTLCKDHFIYIEQRTSARNLFDSAVNRVTENDARRNEINAETIELRGKCQRASDFIIDAKSKLPQLEASKKSAVATKNFRGAQQIAKQIATMTDQMQANESLVAQSTGLLEKLENEVADLSSEIARAQVEVEESKIVLLQLDYDFFSNAVTVLENLFGISPFAEKLLRPLYQTLEFALAHTEVPKQMSREELEEELNKLNDQLNEAIACDDFDTAAILQEQIDTISAKLERNE